MPNVIDLPNYRPARFRLMFSCACCKAVRNVEAVEVRFTVRKDTYGNDAKTRFYNLVDVPEAWAPRTAPMGFERGRCPGLIGRCGACGVERRPSGSPAVSGREMAIKLKPEHKCDARCRFAKGHSCECSCSGKGHGAGFNEVTT